MGALLAVDEEELNLIVRKSISSDDEMIAAIVNAFLTAGVDVHDRSTTLSDWIDPTVFEGIQWSSDRPLYLRALIWDHRVVLTPEEIQIYTPPGDI